jgi:hypothetical protein
MHENIFAIFLLKKTEPLAVIEPFYRTFCHVLLSPDTSCVFYPGATTDMEPS